MENKKAQRTTSYIKHLAVSGLSGVSARIKGTCNLTGKCSEIGNKTYRQTVGGKFRTRQRKK